MAARDRHQKRLPFAGSKSNPGSRKMKRLDVRMEAALSLDLQEFGDRFFRHVRNIHMRGESPFERETDNAMALSHFRGIEMVFDFASDKFCIRGQRIERQSNGKRL